MTITLEAAPRSAQRSVTKHLRRTGHVPAIVYGAIMSPIAISVDARAFNQVLKDAGESTIVELMLDGRRVPTLIHALAHSPLNHHYEHVDFLAVDVTHAVEVDVPLVFIGVAPAEKVGVITKVLHNIAVSALPSDLPHDITVDLGMLLEVDATIRIKDIPPITGVTFLHNTDDVIVSVTSQAADEPVSVATVQSEPELANEKKEKEVV